MIALDTNVLLRLAIGDDPPQARRVVDLLQRSAEAEERCWISDVVLCELEWVLESCYGAARGDVAATIQELLSQPLFEFEDAGRVGSALAAYQDGASDFSDCLIGEHARAHGARTCYTFDRQLARLPGFTLLQ